MITGISPARVLFLEYIPWCFLFVEEPKTEKYSRLSGSRYFHEASLFECRFLAIHGSGSLVPLHENRAGASCGMKSICCRTADYIFCPVISLYGSLKADSKSCRLRYSGCGSQDLWFLRHHLYEQGRRRIQCLCWTLPL